MQTYSSPTNQSGSVAVVVALLLTILLGIMTLTIDAGYIYMKKNQCQDAVEAAAMAGAVSLCESGQGYVASVVREIAEENGIPGDKGELTVTFGYYDETEVYSDFSEYKDFVDEANMPANEFINAVHVTYRSETLSLTGMGQDASISSTAVAYLKRIDMVSLDPEGAIDIGNNSVWDNVVFYSNGDISYPQAVTLNTSAGTETFSPPEFNNCRLHAAGQVLSCSVKTKSWNWGMYTRITEILWDSGSPQSGSHILSGVDPITSIRPVDDEYLEEWRDRADMIYTPDQAGEDDIFYSAESSQYKFDLTGLSGVIFFDAEEYADQWEVRIDPQTPQALNSDSITNLTFVTNCKIIILNLNSQAVKLDVGGEDEDQAIFISTGDIEVQPTIGNIQFKGAVFRTGGDFILYHKGGSSSHKIRVIADGSIIGSSYNGDYSKGNINIGLYDITNDSRFAPPCPPVMARLGRLEASEE
ncbi:hypothetical protein DSCO28_70810 [Desulfosarcina ovata subsp. sediminis]|uniref:Putative Flp pilus-assembly TadG-like N-terminal domain-containing protein n=1 Tax=Desulfosarcina ovata subsp. sediminis TaxID=885957 RepID=A0A5K8A1Q3_9BACT|nr:TadE family protein [Desulfosarcina ovata]BBO86515.1 hypothetical protein DSCO28_70810 [Desulfosarcina ovata subsp. sediminis]